MEVGEQVLQTLRINPYEVGNLPRAAPNVSLLQGQTQRLFVYGNYNGRANSKSGGVALVKVMSQANAASDLAKGHCAVYDVHAILYMEYEVRCMRARIRRPHQHERPKKQNGVPTYPLARDQDRKSTVHLDPSGNVSGDSTHEDRQTRMSRARA